MQWPLRSLAFGSVLAILTPAANLAAQATDPIIGTWKLNLAKSTYSPGPPPKSLTVTFEAAGAGLKITSSGVDAQGNPTATSYTGQFDGKDYPVTGSPGYDSQSLKRINASTVQSTRKKAGKVVQTAMRVVSKDGKTYTTTTDGTNAAGKKIHDVAVFEKQ